jgi:Mn2+/Fe2+ NRAMP family transporter
VGVLYVAGLVGTTVVPYNLFLHAAAVREKWSGPEDLPAARIDLSISIVLGAVVSMAIVATSAAMAGPGAGTGAPTITSAGDMAVQLEPLLGPWARAFFAAGLLAAGLSSAVTAPLAAAYATAGTLGWPRDLTDLRVRGVWMLVLGAGIVFAGLGVRPVPAILFAQVANGVLLPAIAVFLLLAVNDRRWMGERVNGAAMNAAGAVVVLVALVLGLRALWGALG